MPIEVEVPNVGIVEFPDGMSQDDISSVLAKQFPSNRPASAALESPQFGASGSRELDPPDGINLDPIAMPEFAPGVDAQFVNESDTVYDPVKNAGIALGKGIIGLPEAAIGAADLVTGFAAAMDPSEPPQYGRIGKALETTVGYNPKVAKEFLSEYLSPSQKAADLAVQKAKGFLPTAAAMLKNPSTIAQTVFEAAPQMLGGAGIARKAMSLFPKVSGAVAAGLGEGSLQAGTSAEQLRQTSPTGLIAPKQAALAASSGLATGIIGATGGKLGQQLGLFNIDTLFAGAPLTASAKSMTRQILESAIVEGGEEVSQSALEQMHSNLALSKPLLEGVPEAAAQGLLAGIAMGVPGGVVGGSRKPQEKQPEEIPITPIEIRPTPVPEKVIEPPAPIEKVAGEVAEEVKPIAHVQSLLEELRSAVSRFRTSIDEGKPNWDDLNNEIELAKTKFKSNTSDAADYHVRVEQSSGGQSGKPSESIYVNVEITNPLTGEDIVPSFDGYRISKHKPTKDVGDGKPLPDIYKPVSQKAQPAAPVTDLFPDLKGRAPTLERVRRAIDEAEAAWAAIDENTAFEDIDLAKKRVDTLRALGLKLEGEAVKGVKQEAQPAAPTVDPADEVSQPIGKLRVPIKSDSRLQEMYDRQAKMIDALTADYGPEAGPIYQPKFSDDAINGWYGGVGRRADTDISALPDSISRKLSLHMEGVPNEFRYAYFHSGSKQAAQPWKPAWFTGNWEGSGMRSGEISNTGDSVVYLAIKNPLRVSGDRFVEINDRLLKEAKSGKHDAIVGFNVANGETIFVTDPKIIFDVPTTLERQKTSTPLPSESAETQPAAPVIPEPVAKPAPEPAVIPEKAEVPVAKPQENVTVESSGQTGGAGDSATIPVGGVQTPQIVQIIARRNKRDWSKLPSQFQLDAVRAAFQDVKDLFPKKAIQERISASKATTFEELNEAVLKALKKTNKPTAPIAEPSAKPAQLTTAETAKPKPADPTEPATPKPKPVQPFTQARYKYLKKMVAEPRVLPKAKAKLAVELSEMEKNWPKETGITATPAAATGKEALSPAVEAERATQAWGKYAMESVEPLKKQVRDAEKVANDMRFDAEKTKPSTKARERITKKAFLEKYGVKTMDEANDLFKSKNKNWQDKLDELSKAEENLKELARLKEVAAKNWSRSVTRQKESQPAPVVAKEPWEMAQGEYSKFAGRLSTEAFDAETKWRQASVATGREVGGRTKEEQTNNFGAQLIAAKRAMEDAQKKSREFGVGKHQVFVQRAIREGKITSHPDYPALAKEVWRLEPDPDAKHRRLVVSETGAKLGMVGLNPKGDWRIFGDPSNKKFNSPEAAAKQLISDLHPALAKEAAKPEAKPDEIQSGQAEPASAESKLNQIVNDTIEQTTSPKKLGITPGASSRPTDVVLGAVDLKSVSPKAEAVWQSSLREKPSILGRLQESAVNAWHSITREYAGLNPREFSHEIDILRRLRASRNTSSRRTVDILRGITHNIGPKQYGVFNRVLVLEDLLKDVESGKYDGGKDLPSGHLNAAELVSDLQKFKSIADATPEIKAALERRGEFMNSLRETLVERGFLPESVLNDPRYFHHQVLMYLSARNSPGSAKSFRDWFSGWQKSRIGSSKTYNRQYIEAEAEVIADAFNKMTMQDLQGEMRGKADLTAELKALHGEDWRQHIPAGHVAWQPKKGNIFYPVRTVAERAMEDYLNGIKDLLPDDFKEAVAIGPKRQEWIIPKELGKVLDNLTDPKDTWVERFASAGIGGWKEYILHMPLRFLKYELNNLSGDVDFVFAAQPKIFKEFKQAAKDAHGFHVQGKAPVGDLKTWMETGVIASGWRVNELPRISSSEYFTWLTGDKPGIVTRYRDFVGKWNDAREDVARLATARYALKEWNAGRPFYGASVPADVQALPTNTLKAAKVARELLIDYGRETEFGEFMRRKAVPFYRWMHGNFARYIQLAKNIKTEEGAGAAVGRLGTVGAKQAVQKGTALAARAAVFYFIANAWNHLMFPKEEEELGENRNQLHLILGRDDQGNIQSLRLQGAFSDVLGWFGMEDLPSDAADVFKGKESLGDKSEQAYEAAISRAVNAASPFYKTGAETLMKQSLYPNALKPRPIRDRAEHVAGLFSLKNVYKWLAGLPHRPLAQEVSSLLTYNTDPGEAAYNTIRHVKYQWMEKRGMEPDRVIPGKRSNALYYYKQALRYKDEKLAEKFLDKYEKLGGTDKGLNKSIERYAPLSGLDRAEEDEFFESLSLGEKAVLERAEAWFDKVYK